MIKKPTQKPLKYENVWPYPKKWVMYTLFPWVFFDHLMCRLNSIDYRLSWLEYLRKGNK